MGLQPQAAKGTSAWIAASGCALLAMTSGVGLTGQEGMKGETLGSAAATGLAAGVGGSGAGARGTGAAGLRGRAAGLHPACLATAGAGAALRAGLASGGALRPSGGGHPRRDYPPADQRAAGRHEEPNGGGALASLGMGAGRAAGAADHRCLLLRAPFYP